jgi:acetoin utilization protein AcuC
VLRRAGIARIAYVDLDAHHGDGVEAAFAGDAETLLVSVHEERRWPFTGGLEDDGGGNAFNLPIPAGFNDTEMAAVVDRLILPRVAAFRPDALVVQCGADALLEDPLSRLALSNGALWRAVAALVPLAPRILVLGGGGYDPWSVARCWAGVWATLAGEPIPDRLSGAARDVLAAIDWRLGRRGAPPAAALVETLADPPRPGPLRAEVRDRLDRLARR